jgi:tetratricopeptide (TPR) repeat protein
MCLCGFLGITLTACTQPSYKEQLALGEAAMRLQDDASAILHYKQALTLFDESLDARIALGTLYLRQGDLQSAASAFEKAYNQMPLPDDSLVQLLAATYNFAGRYDTLMKLIDTHLINNDSTTNSLYMSLYEVLATLGKAPHEESRSNAVAMFDALTSRYPEQIHQCTLCLYTKAQLRSASEPAEAIHILDTLLAFPAKVASEELTAYAHLLRGQLQFALRNPRSAMADFERFEVLQPKAAYVKFLLAVTALQLKESKRAEYYVDIILLNRGNQPFANWLKAMLEFEQKHYKAAKHHAEIAIHGGLNNVATYIIAGFSAYHENQFESAYRHTKKALRDYPNHPKLRRLLILLNVKLGYADEAGNAMLAKGINHTRDVLLGNAVVHEMIQGGQSQAAEQLLDQISTQMRNLPVPSLLAKMQNVAIRQLFSTDEQFDTKQNEDAPLVDIVTLIERGQTEAAYKKACQWLAQSPNQLDALNLLAALTHQRGEANQAARYYRLARQQNPDNIPSLLFEAQDIMMDMDELDANGAKKAERKLKRILTLNPEHIGALRSLLTLSFYTQTPPDWVEMFKYLVPKSPDLKHLSDEHLVALVDAAFKWQQPGILDTFIFDVAPASTRTPMAWMLWLKSRYALDGKEAFSSHAKTYLSQHPGVSHTLYVISVLQSQRDNSTLLSFVEQLPSELRDTETVQLQYIVALMETGQWRSAELLFGSLDEPKFGENRNKHEKPRSKYPFQTLTQSTRWYIKGRLKAYQGDIAQAASYLSAYYNALPSFHSVSPLHRVLIRAGRVDDAVALAKEYRDTNSTDTAAILSLGLQLAPVSAKEALVLLQTPSLQWAIKRNASLSNNMALLHYSQQNLDEALFFSSNAYKLQPDEPRIKQTHITILNALERDSNLQHL